GLARCVRSPDTTTRSGPACPSAWRNGSSMAASTRPKWRSDRWARTRMLLLLLRLRHDHMERTRHDAELERGFHRGHLAIGRHQQAPARGLDAQRLPRERGEILGLVQAAEEGPQRESREACRRAAVRGVDAELRAVE